MAFRKRNESDSRAGADVGATGPGVRGAAGRDPVGPGALAGDQAAVGDRVRRLRTARALSLSALARAAGVGKATLSGLEAGMRNPTLDTLHAVAAALHVPVTALLGGTGSDLRGSAVRVEVLRVFHEGPVTVELCTLSLPAGTAQVSPAHHVGVTEHVTVFAGTLRAGPVDAPGEAGPGGYLEWASDVPHGYAAVGPEDVRASLLIRTPGD